MANNDNNDGKTVYVLLKCEIIILFAYELSNWYVICVRSFLTIVLKLNAGKFFNVMSNGKL